LAELNGVRKMEGYSKYYRIKLGEYRLGVRLENSELVLIRISPRPWPLALRLLLFAFPIAPRP